MKDWLDPFDDVPSWLEIGKTVEAELNSGELVVGTLEYDEMTSGPDEQPLCYLKTAEEKLRWFNDIKRFRYLPPP